MAHFAEINNTDNVVVRVIVIDNDVVDANGGDLSTEAENYCASLFPENPNTYWKQTSYNNNFRANLADCQGGVYRPAEDVFVPAKPSLYPSWVLDTDVWRYLPPLEYPGSSRPNGASEDEWTCIWNEELWNSSGNTNGWTSMLASDINNPDTTRYYLDQATMTWSLIND